ncbi:MAG: PadR family transcriptional regulator [Candidatus Bipolaricaulia bacterium]
MRQGFLKFYLLKLLSESSGGLSGYELMKRIEEETGFWRPSPGSIYPLLAALEERELIRHRPEGDKKIYSLTAKGEEALAKAQEARAEALEGMRRSIQLLAGIFGEDLAEGLTDEPLRAGRLSAVSPGLRARLVQLRALIRRILSRELEDEEVRGIARILEEAIEELRAYAEPKRD